MAAEAVFKFTCIRAVILRLPFFNACLSVTVKSPGGWTPMG